MNIKYKKMLSSIKLVIARILTIGTTKNIWLISEKVDEARDNGYYFFKYCMENLNKDEEKNIYYLMEKNSKDFEKIKIYEKNIIKPNSLKHCIFYFKSCKLITSQAIPYPVSEKICKKFFKVKNQKFYWLQHGITKDYLRHEDMDYKHKQYSLVCCASPYEKDFFINEYGYNAEQAICTGFCRFDGLIDESNTNNYILVMPTFRKWLSASDPLKEPTKEEEKSFINSDFYEKYTKLLSDEKLLRYLKENNLVVIFYMHYALQNYSYLFKKFENNNVIIAHKDKYDVQDLMKKSKIMITDYSSVFFDYAYMYKPVIYFQFDVNKFRDGHYKEGYFSYKDNGFGPVFDNSLEVIEYLISTADREFKIEKKYESRIRMFFPPKDNLNCKRIFDIINGDR